jgi:hypothetical protein
MQVKGEITDIHPSIVVQPPSTGQPYLHSRQAVLLQI